MEVTEANVGCRVQGALSGPTKLCACTCYCVEKILAKNVEKK